MIDTRTRRVIATIPVGRSPIQLFATPDGRFVYVANQGTEARPDSTVSVIDTQRNAVVKSIITGRGAHGVVVSDDGRFVFISQRLRRHGIGDRRGGPARDRNSPRGRGTGRHYVPCTHAVNAEGALHRNPR